MAGTGALNPGQLPAVQSHVPNYAGTPGCTSASCAGASESGYFHNTGDVGALDAAGSSAASTDPNFSKVRQMGSDAAGWNVTTSNPVQNANAVSSGFINTPQTLTSCVDATVCTEYTTLTAGPYACQVPGTSQVNCFTDLSAQLTANACAAPPVTPPVDTETLSGGCSQYASLVNSDQATLVSSVCQDSAPRVLQCSTPTGLAISSGGFNSWYVDLHPGVAQAYYSVDGLPSFDGTNWVVQDLLISGNAIGQNKYGCTWITASAGTLTLTPGGSGTISGHPNFCNGGCGCWGYPMNFTLGALTMTGPTAFAIPLTVTWNYGSFNTTVVGGFKYAQYTVTPSTGCWREAQVWDFATQVADTCQPYRAAGCLQTDTQCTQVDPVSGTCQLYADTFTCSGGQACTKTSTVKQCNQCGVPGSLVPFCMDTSSPPNTNLMIAATYMNVIQNIQDDYDISTLRLFTGQEKTCKYSTIGTVIQNCCASDPSELFLFGPCPQEAFDLASDRKAHKAHLVGTDCSQWLSFGLGKVCVQKEEVYCTYHSELARMIQEQGRPQIGLNFGSPDVPDCEGFSLAQFATLNFAAMDFTEFYSNINVSIDPVLVGNQMKARACVMSGGTNC